MIRPSFVRLFVASAALMLAAEGVRAQDAAPAAAADSAATGTFVIFKTTMGNFVAKLETERAPNTSANFSGLAEGSIEWTDPKSGQKVKRPYYDGLTFHRVAKGFVIQGGCPLGTGTGDPGFKIKREIHPELLHKKGALSMARGGHPDSAGSQFFVCLDDVPQLDGGYAVFGYVVHGIETVDKIGKVRITPQMGPDDGRPIETITMEKVVVVKGTEADWKAKLAELEAPAAAAAAAPEAAPEAAPAAAPAP